MRRGVICGRGGHGVITVNRMLGAVASTLGIPSISAETHGMAMRGGSVATYVKIGPFHSPSIGRGEADFMIATDATEARRNADACGPEALCVLDAAAPVAIDGLRVFALDASAIAARELGTAIAAGGVLLGAFFAHDPAQFPRARVLPLVEKVFPKAARGVALGYDEVVSHV